jgi:hypothetical protein
MEIALPPAWLRPGGNGVGLLSGDWPGVPEQKAGGNENQDEQITIQAEIHQFFSFSVGGTALRW